MGLYSNDYGLQPGLTTPNETYEAAWGWGPQGQRIYTDANVYSGAVDAGSTPTTLLRVGLVMAIRTADGLWSVYSPTATDGTEVAQGILPQDLMMLDLLSGSAVQRFVPMIVGGDLQASKLIGLDLMARAQLASHFTFDDNYLGNRYFEWRRFQTKATSYTVTAADNFTLFDTTGAGGEVDFTLPAIANGYRFGFKATADQVLKVVSAEGTNIIAFNNAGASSVAFAGTGATVIGGGFNVYSNPAGTKWYVDVMNAGANVVTVA